MIALFLLLAFLLNVTFEAQTKIKKSWSKVETITQGLQVIYSPYLQSFCLSLSKRGKVLAYVTNEPNVLIITNKMSFIANMFVKCA